MAEITQAERDELAEYVFGAIVTAVGAIVDRSFKEDDKIRISKRVANRIAEAGYRKQPEGVSDTDRLRQALVDMRFAYVNKDPDMPHSFELAAMKECEFLVGPWPAPMEQLFDVDRWKWRKIQAEAEAGNG